jgi:hypothetical protein
VQVELPLEEPLELLPPHGKPVQEEVPLDELPEPEAWLPLLELELFEPEPEPEPRFRRHLPPLQTAVEGQSALVVQPAEPPPLEQLGAAKNTPTASPKGRAVATRARVVVFMARVRSRIEAGAEGLPPSRLATPESLC